MAISESMEEGTYMYTYVDMSYIYMLITFLCDTAVILITCSLSTSFDALGLPCSFFPKPPANGGPEGGPAASHAAGSATSSVGSSHSHSSLLSSSGSASMPPPSRLPFSSSAHSGLHYSAKSHAHPHAGKSFAELELAKALLELPGGSQASSSSSSKSLGYHTPSPKPSPGKGKGLVGAKKKLSSSSPGEHEGYYPCNRCGR